MSELNTIRNVIDRLARLDPLSAFLISPETGRVLTFEGLQKESVLLRTRLLQMGLEKGDKVAFLMDNGLFTAQLFLGTIYSGFVSVPLNVRAGVSQLTYMLDHCDAKVVFVEPQYQPLMAEAMKDVSREIRILASETDNSSALAEEIAGEGVIPDDMPAGPAPDDVALLMYSSGSTGKPKAAIHTHSTIIAGGRNSIVSHQLSASDRSLLVLPLYHINAECVTLVPTLLSGGSVVIPRRFNVSQFWDWMEAYRCTWTAMVPTIVSQLIEWNDPHADARAETFKRIRFIRSSSAPLSPAMQTQFLAKFDILLIQAMGSTETGNIFSNPLPPRENKIGTPGLPWGFETRIVDRQGAQVPAGDAGEVMLRGAAMMRGYYKDPEGTAAVLSADGWLRTGDLACQDDDGYFFFVGRSKELIIKGGVNIAPRQIDEVLESHPAILEAAAVGVPDRHMGEDVIAFAVLRPGFHATEGELITYCESRLGQFKTPTRIYFSQDLPKGPSGKVQRLSLLKDPRIAEPAQTSGSNEPAAGHESVRTNDELPDLESIEQIVAEVWGEFFGGAAIDARSDFFELGGDSLLALQCLSRLREKLPVMLSLSDLFGNSTVAGQAAVARQRMQSSPDFADLPVSTQPAGIVPRDRSLPCPLSSGQERLWFVEQLNPGLPVYNESESVRLHGEFDVDALERALNMMIGRREILRTTFGTVNGEPVAIPHDEWPLRVKRIDLTALAPAERETELQRLLIAEPAILFRLEAEPGFRVTSIRLGAEDHAIILVMHHLVCDWASLGILWRELSDAYQALRHGEEPDLPPINVQHGDYAAWQRDVNAKADLTEDLKFWEEYLRDAPEVLALPADRPRPPVKSYKGSRVRFRLNAVLTEALRHRSRQEKTSLFTLFSSVLNVLLYRYSGSGDVLLGIPIADRDLPELRSVIGFLLHVHVLRTSLTGDLTFRELLARVQDGVMGLYQHRAAPFDQVFRKSGHERNPGYSPLFQVMLIWRDREQHPCFIGLDGVEIESLMSESGTSKFDLILFATDFGDKIWLEMEYNTDLYDQDRIERMMRHFETLLESVVADSAKAVGELPMLPAAERWRILTEWNRTEIEYPSHRCVHELIEQQTRRTPDAVAAIFGNQRLSYSQLNEKANRLARYLRDAGVGRDVLAGICVERSMAMLVGVLAILKAGGAYVPIDPALPRERRDFMLKDSMAPVVLTEQALRDSFTGYEGRTICMDSEWNAIQAAPASNLENIARPGSLAYVLFTSGSTGKPKGVAIEHHALLNLLFSMRRQPGLSADDVLVAVTTLSFDIAGLELFLPLLSGARVVIAGSEQVHDGRQMRRLLEDEHATVLQATPATWRMLLESGWQGNPRLKMLCGGEAMPRELAEQLLACGGELWNLYGPTETTIWSAVARVESGTGPVPIGKPIANTRLLLLDANRQLAPIGVPGELCIGGAGLARGYIGRPELTAEKFIADPFSDRSESRLYRTGDLARYLPDGSLEFLGRMDHQVKVRGFRIELGEIESALSRHPQVAQCAVVASEDGSRGTRLLAYIVPAADFPANAEMREFLMRTLPDYMVPSGFITLASLPLTPNGKVDRKALLVLDSFSILRDSISEKVLPSTVREQQLALIWEHILGVQAIGVNDNFFDLGGHSLAAVRLVNEVSRILNVGFPIPAFVREPTIKGMAKVIETTISRDRKPELLELKAGQSGEELFFVGAGLAECRMAQALDAGAAMFASWVPVAPASVRAVLSGDTAAIPRTEDLAAAHAALILSHSNRDRCMLAGYCFYGLLAFETAHQLQRLGQPVDTVFLLDARATFLPWWRKLSALPAGLVPELAKKRAMRFRSKITGGAEQNMTAQINGADLFEPQHVADPMDADVPSEEWQAFLRGMTHHTQKTYNFQPLDSRGVLFRTVEGASAAYNSIDPEMGWKGLFTRGLEIVDLPCDHESLVRDIYVQGLAQRLSEIIGRSSADKSRSDILELTASAP